MSRTQSSPHANSPPAPTIIGPYTMGPTIGAGIFAEVKLGSDEFRQQVAIKMFHKEAIMKKAHTQTHQTSAGNGQMNAAQQALIASGGTGGASLNQAVNPYQSHQFLQIEKEINSLRICSHPNIVQFYDVLETESHVYLVMEHLPYGELYDYILSKGKLSEAEAGKLFNQVVSALRHCHERGIVHRDLKPENILLTKDGDLKLVDFGLANYWNTKEDIAVRSLRTQCGSPHYASPEILTGQRYSGPLADVWSLGVLLYAMLCGSLPFNARSIPMLIKKIVEGKFKLPKYLSPHAQHLIQTILQITPENRPSIQTLQEHPWMVQHRGTSEQPESAADGKKPLSRPEIISPQSYTNSRAHPLLSSQPSVSSHTKGYSIANANGTPDDGTGERLLESGSDEDDEDEDADIHVFDANPDDSDTDRPRAISGARRFTRTSNHHTDATPHTLPPSSVLSFQPENQFLAMLADGGSVSSANFAASDGRSPSGTMSSNSQQQIIPGSSTSSNSAWPLHSGSKKPLICPGCNKQLRPRTHADSGAFILSSSISANQQLHPGAPNGTSSDSSFGDLCQCTIKHQPQIVPPSDLDGSITPHLDQMDRPRSSTLSSDLPPTSPAPSSSTPNPIRKKSSYTTPPKPQLTPEELARQEALYKERVAALFRAAEKGDVNTIAELIAPTIKEPVTSTPSSPSAPSSPTPTTTSASSLLPPPPLDVRVTTIDSWNSLHYAARHGHVNVAHYLLTCWQVLDINCRTKQGWTPLMLAADRGHTNIVNLLLRYGAAIHVTNNDGKSAIFLARESGYPAIAQALTNASSARNLRHQLGASGITEKNGEQIKELNHEFFRAAECGDLGKVRHLLQLGSSNSSPKSTAANGVASPNKSNDPAAIVPLSARRNSPKPDTDSSLPAPRYCVDILAKGIDNWSVLHFAARKGRTPVVVCLLDHDPPPDLDATTKNGWTPLMLAADRGHTETCQVLVERGADPNLRSNDGYTALSVAEEGGHKEIIKLLSKLTGFLSPPHDQANGTSRVPILTPVTSPGPQR